ncbi:MAG: hypothetical protein COA79_05010 [Planctomycetota bacterium]|nr:MAG: hypothetical protein COA79_05010 [Planctomycetota bacterium]
MDTNELHDIEISSSRFDKVHLILVSFLIILQPLIVVSIRLESDLTESLYNALVLFTFFISALVCYQHKSIYFPYKTAGILILFFSVFCVGHYFLSHQYLSGHLYLIQFLVLLLLCFSVLQSMRHTNTKVIFLVLLYVQGLFQAYAGLYQRLISSPFLKSEILADPNILFSYNLGMQIPMIMDRVEGMLPHGTFIYPNAFGMFMVLHLINTFMLFYVFKSFFRKYLLIFLIFIVIGILPALFDLWVTDAKGVWVSAIASMCFTIYIYFWNRSGLFLKRSFWFVSLILIVLTCGVVYKIAPNVLSFKVRIDYWKGGWDIIAESSQYIFGVGVGGFSERYAQYKVESGWEVRNPHNYFIFILISYGFVGLILFTSILIFYLKTLVNIKPEENNIITKKRITLELGFEPFVYHGLLVFIVLSYYFIPKITGHDLDSILVVSQLFGLIIIIASRMILNQKLFVPLKFEKYLIWQLILFISFLFICFFYFIPNIFDFGNWVNIDELNKIEIVLLSFVCLVSLLYLIFNIFSDEIFTFNFNPMVGLYSSLFIISFFVLMIFGDMTFHFPAIVTTVMILSLCSRQFFSFAKKSDYIDLSETRMVSVFSAFVCLVILIVYFCFIKVDLKNSFAISKYQLIDLELQKSSESFSFEKKSKLRILALEKLLMEVPNNYGLRKDLVNVHKELAQIYMQNNTKAKAQEQLMSSLKNIDKMIELKPFLAQLHSEKADNLIHLLAKKNLIIEAFVKACNLYPLKATYHLQLGDFYKLIKEYKNASKSYTEAQRCHMLSDRRTKLNKVEYTNLKKNLLEIKQLSD